MKKMTAGISQPKSGEFQYIVAIRRGLKRKVYMFGFKNKKNAYLFTNKVRSGGWESIVGTLNIKKIPKKWRKKNGRKKDNSKSNSTRIKRPTSKNIFTRKQAYPY